jgi:hypothetical protein
LPVKEAFERNMAAAAASDPSIATNASYLYFDFHTECKGMRFDRVSLLVDRLKPFLGESGWFHSVTPPITNLGTSGGETRVNRTQGGVIRSNCMDCLDRTNVAQSALGRWALNAQLREIGVLSVKETVEEHPEFMNIFRNGASRVSTLTLHNQGRATDRTLVWADHGDTVSCAYAGTGALKSDFTRTGKRSREGMAQDGVNSVMRYVKNNFFDGDRQVSVPQCPSARREA